MPLAYVFFTDNLKQKVMPMVGVFFTNHLQLEIQFAEFSAANCNPFHMVGKKAPTLC